MDNGSKSRHVHTYVRNILWGIFRSSYMFANRDPTSVKIKTFLGGIRNSIHRAFEWGIMSRQFRLWIAVSTVDLGRLLYFIITK